MIEIKAYIYYPETGQVYSKYLNRNLAIHKGNEYIRIVVDGKMKKAHRYFYELYHNLCVHPNYQIDHINRNKLDNSIENLRILSRPENQQNRDKQINSTSGLKGVHWHKRVNKWQASIGINGKKIHLGYYDSEEIAYEVYLNYCHDNGISLDWY